MRDILPDLEHVTPEWLTEMLQDQGHLQDGRVVAVHLKKMWPTAVSLVAHLEVQYTDDTSALLPALLLKDLSNCLYELSLTGSKRCGLFTRITALPCLRLGDFDLQRKLRYALGSSALTTPSAKSIES